MTDNKIYDSSIDFDDIINDIVTDATYDDVDASDDEETRLRLSLFVDSEKYNAESISNALMFIIKDLWRITNAHKSFSYGFDFETSAMSNPFDNQRPNDPMCILNISFSRPDFLSVREISAMIDMMSRVYPEGFDYSFSSLSFVYKGREHIINGKFFNAENAAHSFNDIKQMFKFCIAFARIDRASELFELQIGTPMEQLMLQKYLSKNISSMRPSKFVISREQRLKVAGYRPKVQISKMITDGKKLDIEKYIEDGHYVCRGMLPNVFIAGKLNTNLRTFEIQEIFVYFNLLVDDDFNIGVLYNEIEIPASVDYDDVAEYVLKYMNQKEAEKLKSQYNVILIGNYSENGH